ncbi:MAG TPA: ATP synthase F1 subunit delta [Acidimicrobiales bacterium]|nr:ATP synthase F1 subunit delta [Acidimicrobiales bacterium]
MLELVRGYAAAVFDEAEAAGRLEGAVAALDAVRGAVVSSERLRGALTDGSIPASDRAAVLTDLLEGKVPAEIVALVTFPVLYERAGESPKTYELLLELAESRQARAAAGGPMEPEPPIGRAGAMERLRGFAERTFERLDDQAAVDAIEDELFRFARIAEQHHGLRAAIAGPVTALEARLEILDDLLAGKVRPETIALLGYVLRTGRARDLVGTADYLVNLAAAERGRRVADVRAAVELDADERTRLAAALGRLVRRSVELRVVIDPSVIGGIRVSVGDTVIDGTLRHRLDQLRDSLLLPS